MGNTWRPLDRWNVQQAGVVVANWRQVCDGIILVLRFVVESETVPFFVGSARFVWFVDLSETGSRNFSRFQNLRTNPPRNQRSRVNFSSVVRIRWSDRRNCRFRKYVWLLCSALLPTGDDLSFSFLRNYILIALGLKIVVSFKVENPWDVFDRRRIFRRRGVFVRNFFCCDDFFLWRRKFDFLSRI